MRDSSLAKCKCTVYCQRSKLLYLGYIVAIRDFLSTESHVTFLDLDILWGVLNCALSYKLP